MNSVRAQVGTISANGEREIGELIARAMEKVKPQNPNPLTKILTLHP